MEYLRTRLERPLVHSMGDSEIFHVQLLKMVTKNEPGNYHNFVLVHIQSKSGGTLTDMNILYLAVLYSNVRPLPPAVYSNIQLLSGIN